MQVLSNNLKPDTAYAPCTSQQKEILCMSCIPSKNFWAMQAQANFSVADFPLI